MSLLSPIWLVALIPWMAVAIWVFIGRQTVAAVPFLALWPRSAPRQLSNRRFFQPPLPVLLCLLAALLGILAAAHPVLARRNMARPLVVLVDRGLTMSSTTTSGVPRYVKLAGELAQAIGPSVQADILSPGLPDRRYSVESGKLAEVVAKLRPTALNQRQELIMQAAAARNSPDNPVVVAISDFPVPGPTITVTPDKPASDVAIAAMSARRQPQKQVMVRLLNSGDAARIHLHVQSDEQTQSLDVDVPGGGSKNVFVDMPSLGPSVKAWIDSGDENPLDDAAWLVRQPLWPRVEVHGDLPQPLRRMIQTYTRLRPADDSSATVVVQDAAQPLPDFPVACVADNAAVSHVTLAHNPQITFADDPLNIAKLDWPAMLSGAALADAPAGWQVIVQADGHPVLAINDSPRRVWAGFISAPADRSVDYVIFWGKVFDWLGAAGDQYTSIPVQQLDDSWTPIDTTKPSFGENGFIPGLYRASDGTLQAVNAKVEDMPFSPSPHWRQDLNQAMKTVHGQVSLSPWLALAGLLVLAAAITIHA